MMCLTHMMTLWLMGSKYAIHGQEQLSFIKLTCVSGRKPLLPCEEGGPRSRRHLTLPCMMVTFENFLFVVRLFPLEVSKVQVEVVAALERALKFRADQHPEFSFIGFRK